MQESWVDYTIPPEMSLEDALAVEEGALLPREENPATEEEVRLAEIDTHITGINNKPKNIDSTSELDFKPGQVLTSTRNVDRELSMIKEALAGMDPFAGGEMEESDGNTSVNWFEKPKKRKHQQSKVDEETDPNKSMEWLNKMKQMTSDMAEMNESRDDLNDYSNYNESWILDSTPKEISSVNMQIEGDSQIFHMSLDLNTTRNTMDRSDCANLEWPKYI